MSRQRISNFQDENLCDIKKLEAEANNVVAYKKRVFEKFSETGVGAEGTEKRQFGLGCGHKIQSINPIKYFILTKHIVCNRPLQILEVLYV